jgi:hypothetical protein
MVMVMVTVVGAASSCGKQASRRERDCGQWQEL